MEVVAGIIFLRFTKLKNDFESHIIEVELPCSLEQRHRSVYKERTVGVRLFYRHDLNQVVQSWLQ